MFRICLELDEKRKQNLKSDNIFLITKIEQRQFIEQIKENNLDQF